MTIQEAQEAIIKETAGFGSRLEMYDYLVAWGEELPGLEDSQKNDRNALPGCQSRVWITAKLENGRILFAADSDSVILRGMLALLVRVLQNRTPEEAASADLYFLRQLGLEQHLSPARAAGLRTIVRHVRQLVEHLVDTSLTK